MPQLLNQVGITLKAIHQLGLRQVGLYAYYRLTLETGWLAYRTRQDVARALHQPSSSFSIHPLIQLPDSHEVSTLLGRLGFKSLLIESDDIVDGSVRLFGGEPVPLDLSQSSSSLGWTAYAQGRARYPVQDIKFLWEPARFGWVFTLGRAYLLTGDERYADAFWGYALPFINTHTPNNGLHWISAQEVALRILAFTWAAQVFSKSPNKTPDQLTILGKAIAAHAARIPATLSYSRAQNNNHLLSEAVGLLTAGLTLRDHPQSPDWLALGTEWLNRGLLDQISIDGTYIQHSTSYHRFMLQLALWVHCITRSEPSPFTTQVLERLAAATSWLLNLLDESSGQVPNLGPNDGANILPLTICPHSDYRPVLQAASLAFLGTPSIQPGNWDEMSMWLGLHKHHDPHIEPTQVEPASTPYVLCNSAHRSWAYFRSAHFNSRPGHADQLHLDLWWRGINIAQDAGTYLYNAPPPWSNALTHTNVHNTIMVDEQDQMNHVGKFLYLDWAQAEVINRKQLENNIKDSITAQHDGYRKIGLIHKRSVTSCTDGSWRIDDHLEPFNKPLRKLHSIRLHWLVPDWPWEVIELPDDGTRVDIQSPNGCIRLHMIIADRANVVQIKGVHIVRAGKVIYGCQAASATWGWVSPTYGVKLPALSLSYEVVATLPLVLSSHWSLPPEAQSIRD